MDSSGSGFGGNETCSYLNTNFDCMNTPTAVSLPTGRNAVALYGGEHHNCAVLDDNSVVCWGKNDAGQLNDGTTINRYVPIRVRL